MNCDDRRYALMAYRDGFEGKTGQSYGWRNPNGGGAGSITPLKSFMLNGYACRQFRESSNTGPRDRKVTACRQDDGNWHIS